MQVTISKTGTFSNGDSWAWSFGRGVEVKREGRKIAAVQIDGFQVSGMTGAEAVRDIMPEVESVCESCMAYQDEALLAFEWHGLIVLNSEGKQIRGRVKRAGDRREAVIRALSEELLKTACRNARIMMPDSTDSAFEDYESSELIRNKARKLVMKAVA